MPVVFSNWGEQLGRCIFFRWGNLLIFDYLIINSMWTILLDLVWLLMCINITTCFIAFLSLRSRTASLWVYSFLDPQKSTWCLGSVVGELAEALKSNLQKIHWAFFPLINSKHIFYLGENGRKKRQTASDFLHRGRSPVFLLLPYFVACL